MNKPAAIAPVISADPHAINHDFPLRPFAIRHQLVGHPLLSLPRIAQLASELPRDLIEYNGGNVDIGQNPDATPRVDLDPVDVVRRIETCGAWMVLKRIEKSPPYKALLESALMSVARARGFNSLSEADFTQIEGFLFVSSPNATTPFHLDSEDNFFVQVHGDKSFHIYNNNDRSIANDEQIEHSMTRHRNLPYSEEFENRATHFALHPGEGCYVPYQWPHWVRTADTHSISMAITWKTKPVLRNNDLHFCNSILRRVGFAQAAPGHNRGWDDMKLAIYRSIKAIVEPLRTSETVRRLVRRITLGKRANYYYGEA